MAVLFSCLDYEGVPVSCDEEQWTRHIIPRHQEMAGSAAALQRIIGAPFRVHQDGKRPARKLFYGLADGSQPFRSGFIRVVVAYEERSGELRGSVVTAFPSKKIREGDPLLWTRATQT